MYDRLFRKLSQFEAPAPDAWEALQRAFSPQRRYSAGEAILKQFSSPRESTLVLAGLAGRLVTLEGGAQQITALHVAGDFVDLHAFLLRRLDHSVVAMTDCTIASADHGALERITEDFPALTRSLWFLTVTDAAIHRQWLTALGRRDALQRAAHQICELYIRLADVGLATNGRFELDLTQAQFADVLCISTVHANRIVRDLRERGLVDWKRSEARVLDWTRLSRLAEFDPTYLQLTNLPILTPRVAPAA